MGGHQRHLLTTAQLHSCGFTPAGIDSRARRGRLHRVHTGVYSLHPPPFDRLQRWLAAVLAYGRGALLCDGPAAFILRISPECGDRPHVCIPGDRRRRDGIIVRRRAVAGVDRHRREGIPCTSAARTLVDLAAAVSRSELERMLVTADSLRILNRRRLDELLEERRGRPGIRALQDLVTPDPVRILSEVEGAFLGVCRAASLPEPLVNAAVHVGGRTYVVDFCWAELGVIVEIDGYAFHGGRERANADRERDQALSIAGWAIHRFTADQVQNDPQESLRRLGLLLSVRRDGHFPSL